MTKTGFLAELMRTDRLRDWRLLGVIMGEFNKELLRLTDGDLNKKIIIINGSKNYIKEKKNRTQGF